MRSISNLPGHHYLPNNISLLQYIISKLFEIIIITNNDYYIFEKIIKAHVLHISKYYHHSAGINKFNNSFLYKTMKLYNYFTEQCMCVSVFVHMYTCLSTYLSIHLYTSHTHTHIYTYTYIHTHL